MAEPTNTIQPLLPVVASASTFDETAGLAAARNNRIDESGFLVAILPASIEANDELYNSIHRGSQSESLINEGLLSLDKSTIAIFNEISTGPKSVIIPGNLTAQQLQEIGILKDDAEKLEAASLLEPPLPLNNSATTVDLSSEAQIIAQANNTELETNNVSLTQLQIEQAGQILAPFNNEPLTPALLAQIRVQLVASGFNPAQFTLATLAILQSYLATLYATRLEPAAMVEDENELKVAPVSRIVRVAVEYNAGKWST